MKDQWHLPRHPWFRPISLSLRIKPGFVLPVFFLIVFLGAMALGPVLYWGLSWIAPIPFHRAMDRGLLLSALAAVGLFGGRIPLGQLWPWTGEAWKQVLLGLFIAAVSAQAMIGFKAAVDGFALAPCDGKAVAYRILLAVVAAIFAAPIEETVFRGFLQRELIERLGWCAGWIVAAAIFMLAHFVKIPVELDAQPVAGWSGVTAMGAAFQALAEGGLLSGKALNLFLLGLILGGVYLRSGSLWVNAGLHGGLILVQLLYSGLVLPAPRHDFIFGGGDIVSSPITSLVFILLGLWLWLFYRHPSILPETGENAP